MQTFCLRRKSSSHVQYVLPCIEKERVARASIVVSGFACGALATACAFDWWGVCVCFEVLCAARTYVKGVFNYGTFESCGVLVSPSGCVLFASRVLRLMIDIFCVFGACARRMDSVFDDCLADE